jgi:DNA repair protein RecN (Recombination protein N)
MLRSLQIRNFAIIDQIDVEFDQGMTVLTGETGAGKSILVDALGLVLGERGGNGLVRIGADRAEFSAEFGLTDLPEARHWLEEQSLEQGDDCVLRRVINADGRSRAFINGRAVSLQTLKVLGERMLDIHGQHFHQSLGRRDVQRDLLDHFGDLMELRDITERDFAKWQALANQLHDLESADTDRESRLDLLEFQLGELDALDLQVDEMSALQNERQKLQNAGRLADGVSLALQNIYDNDTANAQSLLADACRTLERLRAVDAQLDPILETLNETAIQVGESSDALRRYADTIEMDPARRDWVEERINAIQSVARKHRVGPDALPEVHQRIRESLNALQNAEARSAEFSAETKKAADAYRKSAETLSKARGNAAVSFSAAVTKTMSGLGMPGGTFEATVIDCGQGNEKTHGIDLIEFRISANPGQPLLPLSKVASGGELSRMSLAIQVIASDGNTIPTMIFDEVDSGIGGGVAEMLGRRLKEVGHHCQVLCVTHLPQVASIAAHHYRINKITDGKSTRTGVVRLRNDERIEELARMLGGVSITEKTRAHAAEMLKSA